MTTPMRSRVAAIQMCSGPDVTANLETAARLIERAAADGAHMVTLPEYFALLASDEKAKVAIREREGDGPIQAFLSEAAARHGVWLVGGTVPLVSDDPGRVRNSTLVYDAHGVQQARYDKIHLFGYRNAHEEYDEARTIEAGDAVCTFASPLGRVGLAVCYDLRFPELFRALDEVDLIVLPAAFTRTTGRAHWEVLLRARAIENLCYVAAPAQGGTHPCGRQTWGHSMIVDPWGSVVACREEGEGVTTGEIDHELLTSVRDSLPALRHRRLAPS